MNVKLLIIHKSWKEDEKNVFDFDDYKAYLRAFIQQQPKKGRGLKARLSSTMGCQSAYFSRVLNGDAHLSLEQAHRANSALGHSKDESKFFLLMLLYNKAGTRDLKQEFYEQMEQILQSRLVLKNRLNVKKVLSREDQITYYSAWYYTAVHFLLMISDYQSREAISRRLDLPLKKVTSILDFLVSIGLADQDGQRFKTGTVRIHLENDAAMITKHHSNWRMKSIQAVEREEPDELHYSAIVTIARKDALRIKSELVKAIESVRQVVKDSKEDDLFCYNVDFFKV